MTGVSYFEVAFLEGEADLLVYLLSDFYLSSLLKSLPEH